MRITTSEMHVSWFGENLCQKFFAIFLHIVNRIPSFNFILSNTGWRTSQGIRFCCKREGTEG